MGATTFKGDSNPLATPSRRSSTSNRGSSSVTRAGWLAKAAVYTLMGTTAFTIGRGEPTSDDASPEGALAQVIGTSGGLALLGALAVGLDPVLRMAPAECGDGARQLDQGLGRTGSATRSAPASTWCSAVTAIAAVLHGDDPEDKNTVERLSRSMLQSGVGRWVLLLAGLVARGGRRSTS